MADLFVCGTLRHVPLLESVLGQGAGTLDMAAATLADTSVFEVGDQPFVLIKDSPGANAAGVLLRGLARADRARLEFYQGVYGKEPRTVTVVDEGGTEIQARVFMPESGSWQAGAPWSLEQWAERWGPLTLRAAQEVMAHFGSLSAAEVGARLTGIHIRAAAWLAAQARPSDPDHVLSRDVVVHAHHRRYSNFFATEEMDLQYRRYDGQLSAVLNRGAQVLGQAVVVLPYDPVRDAVLLVEQFRTPLFIGGDPTPWIWEPVSGLIDPGETPQVSARRETMEEAGLHLTRLEKLTGLYSSSGANSEFVHLFLGLADFDNRQAGGGLAGEGEDIRVAIVRFGDLMQGIDQGRYRDMPLVTCALWLARHRDRLREAA